MLSRYHRAAGWIPPLTALGLIQIWTFLALPKWPVLLYVSLWIAAIATSFSARKRFDESVATWVCIVVARTHNLAVEISLYKPMLVGRCFLICLPPSVLLATYGLLQLPRPVSGSALAVLAVASCSSVLSYYRHLGWKEDWRGATSFVISRCEAGDSVVVIPTYGRFTFEFDYYRGLAPAESKMLVYGEWEPGRSFPAPSTGA